MKKLILSLSIFFGLALPVLAQSALTQTTLSAAVNSSQTQFAIASATGVTATSTYLYVDNELMAVNAINSTTVSVTRGYGGTVAQAHVNAAAVYVGAGNAFVVTPAPNPTGSCTRSNLPVVPIIDTRSGAFIDCLNGKYAIGGSPSSSPAVIQNVNTGGTAYTALNTNGTTLSATTQYCSEIDIPSTRYLTGLAILNGTTAAGTDKHIVALYDAGGNLLANSATAGTASATASNFQQIAFTSKFLAVGPGLYFACMQTNGTTDTVRMVVTGVQGDAFLTKGVTGQTFGTLAAFTAPTTFTTAVGPYFYAY